MRLREYIPAERLKWKPRLSDTERKEFRILSQAYRILKSGDSSAAEEVRDCALQILRERYHIDNDAMFRHNRLSSDEWSAVREYFPDRMHPTFFAGNLYGAPILRYLRVARRTYQTVEIRSRGSWKDFAIIGWEPGRKEPSIMARIYDDGTAAPVVHEIRSIIEKRRTLWNWTKPCFTGLTFGTILGLYALSRRQVESSEIDVLIVSCCALIGMAAAFAIMSTVNWKKRRGIQRMYPHLSIPI
jgi:hypothetical protein